MVIVPIIIIMVILAAIVAGILFKVIKTVLRVLIFGAIALCIFLFIAGVLVYFDAGNFRKDYPAGSKKLLLVDDNAVIVGLRTINFNDTSYYQSDDLATMGEAVNVADYQSILGNDYKVVVFEMDAFESVDKVTLAAFNIALDKPLIEDVLHSEESPRIIAQLLYDRLNASVREQIPFDSFYDNTKARIGSDERIKGSVSFAMIEQNENQVAFLVNGMRDDTIVVFPETYLFKMVKFLPESIIQGAIGG